MMTKKKILKPTVLLAAAITVLTLFLLGYFSFGTLNKVESVEADRIRDVLNIDASPEYKIHGICLGIANDAPRDFFIADPSLPKKIKVAFSLWVIVGGGRTILVDTGFTNRKMIEDWRIRNYRHPVTALSDAGFKKEQITDLVITHGHWDHIDGLKLFEPPRLWINKKVFGKLSGPGEVNRVLRKVNSSGRLKVTTGIQAVAPGVVVVPVGLHAPGFQYVVVKSASGVWVLSSDITPLFANYSRGIPTGQTSSPEETLEIHQTILALTGGEVKRIIPGHEPSVYDENPHVVFGP
jgi:glyoxylase-like metal-dependent hydrolase (beta-lactamase superfamily II)